MNNNRHEFYIKISKYFVLYHRIIEYSIIEILKLLLNIEKYEEMDYYV